MGRKSAREKKPTISMEYIICVFEHECDLTIDNNPTSY